jgi:hypothetical protein
VSAPFKSRTKLGLPEPRPGPGPADHFLRKMSETDLVNYPPETAPFETSQERFHDMDLDSLPAPNAYTILSFTDEMKRDVTKHAAAIPNPKLGFLTSAEARPSSKLGALNIPSRPETPRKWRNMRPKKSKPTYGYFGPPPKFPVIRKMFDESSCPAVSNQLTIFYTLLHRILQVRFMTRTLVLQP